MPRLVNSVTGVVVVVDEAMAGALGAEWKPERGRRSAEALAEAAPAEAEKAPVRRPVKK